MKTNAFTRLELLMTVGTVSLLTAVGGSLCADTRERSQSIVCMNNLRQIGRAFNAWAVEHGGDNAWWTSPANGGYRSGDGWTPSSYHVPGVGVFPTQIVQNQWWHFLWIHEDLPSPSVLVCPSDPLKRRAASFSMTPGGLAHASMQNNALSYLIGVHALREFPNEWLSGDRNVNTSADFGGCGDSGLQGVRSIMFGGTATPFIGWTNGIHVTSGNLLLNDGRVEHMTTPELSDYVWASSIGSGTRSPFHLLIP